MSFFSKKTKKTKTESTSQTFGQMIVFKNNFGFVKTPQATTSISPKITNISVLKTTAIGSKNIDDIKAQIAIAAVSPDVDTNSSIVLKEDQNISSEAASNIGSLSNTETSSVSVWNSQTKTKEEIKDILTEAKKVNLSISLKSKDSDKIEFNNLQIPEFLAKFNYNFYVEDEDDIEKQEDPTKINSDDFPRFVSAEWNVVEVSEELTDDQLQKDEQKETNDLKQKVFQDPRGVCGYLDKNFNNSISKSLKGFNLFNLNENVKSEIVDIHKIEKAFDSISNNKLFPNTINASVNTNKENELLSILIKSVK